MSLPVFVIVTPSYNQDEFLEEAIRSVLLQDYPCLRYIVVDGGSTDDSVEIIREYSDHLTYWISEPDKGQSHAVNKGWQYSTGDLYGFLNSDDTLQPGALWTVAANYIAFSQPGVLYGDCFIMDRRGDIVRQRNLANYTFKDHITGSSLPQPSTFFSKETLTDTGLLSEQLTYALDWDLVLRTYLVCGSDRFHYTAATLAASREYPGTKTRTGLSEKGAERRAVIKTYTQDGLLSDNLQVRLAQSGTYQLESAELFLSGRYYRALVSLFRAFMLNPFGVIRKLSKVVWLLRERIQRRSNGQTPT